MLTDMMTILGSIVVILAVIILGPIATIWALNTLFPVVAIPYSFSTWLAALILGGIFSKTIKTSK